jgi:hypothetical protein
MWHAWEGTENCTRFWWEGPNERDHSKDQGVDGRMALELILGRLAGGMGSGFTWVRIGTSGRPSRTR